MYEIAICDDDIVFASAFSATLSEMLTAKKVPFHLNTFSDPSALLDSIKRGEKYHLLFLDILFQTEEGLQFAKVLREKNYHVDIIFITTCVDYAVASYDTAPLYYLLKPVDPEKLDAALSRFLEKNTPNSLHFSTSRGHLYIQMCDILFFEIYGHEIIIHKTNGLNETCMGTLKELEKLLPPLTFVRPHRSYLVNLDHITEIVRYQIRLSSGATIPVSKNLYHQIQDTFIDYAEKNSLSF